MAIRALTIGQIFMRFVLLYLSIVCQHFVCFAFSNLLNVNILFRTIACNIIYMHILHATAKVAHFIMPY